MAGSAFQGPFDQLLATPRQRIDRGDLRRLPARLDGGNVRRLSMRTAPANCPRRPIRTRSTPRRLRAAVVSTFRRYCAGRMSLIWRDKATLWLHLALLVSFPRAGRDLRHRTALPQVRSDGPAGLQTDVRTRSIVRRHARLRVPSRYSAATLVSGLVDVPGHPAGAHGRKQRRARRSPKSATCCEKELQARDFRPWAYVTTKGFLVVGLSLAQAFWMTWFVKTLCGFPGRFLRRSSRFFFGTTLADERHLPCHLLGFAKSPERASLLAIYLVGLAVAALGGSAGPARKVISMLCRPVHRGPTGAGAAISRRCPTIRNFTTLVSQAIDQHFISRTSRSLRPGARVCTPVVCGVIAWIFVARMPAAAVIIVSAESGSLRTDKARSSF